LAGHDLQDPFSLALDRLATLSSRLGASFLGAKAMTQSEGTNDSGEIIHVAPVFEPFLDLAIARMSYLRPDVLVERNESGVRIKSDAAAELDSYRADFNYALYRERHLAETFAIRQRFFARLLG
jgi:hypothetical protein